MTVDTNVTITTALARLYPSEALRPGKYIRVRVDGHPVAVELHEVAWRTWVDCPLPDGYPLALSVRGRRWASWGKRLLTGDVAFDRRYHLEGAPAEVVLRIVDQNVREVLLRFRGTRIRILELETGRLLRLSFDWVPQLTSTLPALVRVVAGLARDLPTASIAVAAAGEQPKGGTPYRPVLDGSAARVALAERHQEATALGRRHAARDKRRKVLKAGLLGAAAAGVAVLVKLLG